MPGFPVGDFLQGFNDRTQKYRDQADQENQQRRGQEQKVFETLANADDPDIRAAAVTGLLTQVDNKPSGLSQWFGKVKEHPMYQTIHNMINGGKQPFMNPEDRPGAALKGRLAGADSAVANVTGEHLSTEDMTAMARGSVGAPPRYQAPQTYVGDYEDPDTGQTVSGGIVSQHNGQYHTPSGTPIPGQIRNLKRPGNTGGNPNAGNHWTTMTPQEYTQKYGSLPPEYKGAARLQVELKADGSLGRVAPTTEPPPPVPAIVQTATGNVGVGRGGAEVNLPPSARGGKAEPPTAGLTALKEAQASILRDAGPEPKPLATGLSVNPQQRAAWEAKRDTAAQRYGYANYADLQAKIGTAQGGVNSAVPPPTVPALPTTPGPKPAAKKPAAATPGAAAGNLDVNKVLDFLGKRPGG